jgi:LmbE family N-acetylglucosaminyl deacetylase
VTMYYGDGALQRHNSQNDVGNSSPAQWLASEMASSELALRPAFVFAHPDDAALSAFYALAETGPRALDVLVCAGRPRAKVPGIWDNQCGFATSHEARVRRLGEHKGVIRMIGANSVALAIVDGQYGDTPDELWHRAGRMAVAHMQSTKSNVVITHCWSPEHVDHQHAVTLARGAARELQIPIVFTCDRPYLSCSADQCHPVGVSSPGYTTCSFLLPTPIWAKKLATIASYSSQLTALSIAFGQSWCDESNLRLECYSVVLPRVGGSKEFHMST